MLTIGDFSKLSRVPITALRYYDEMGLLKPTAVDPQTKYRSYSVDQLPRLNRILALKDLGFTLEQIAQVLDEGVSQEELQGMFRLKQAEIQFRMEQDRERLLRLQTRMRQLAMGERVPAYDVVVKQVEPHLVASVRERISTYQHVGVLWRKLFTLLPSSQRGGLTGLILHDEEYKPRDVDLEAVVYLMDCLPASEHMRVYELPASTMACVVHQGSFNTISQAYGAVIRWIEANEYRIAGPNRELYLSISTPMRQDDESYVIELQFPVAK